MSLALRTLRLAALLLLLTSGPALAAEATLVKRDLRTATTATARFDLVGLHWRGGGSVSFRTRSVSGRWSPWLEAAPEREDRPDAGAGEAMRARGWQLGNPYWVGPSDRIRYRTKGVVRQLRAFLVTSRVQRVPLRALSKAGAPPILPRSAWRADEKIRRAPPYYADSVHFAVVHHTAGTNTYAAEQSASIVRAIQLYHVKANGWNDIGYNFLVDQYGQVFEGRYGGVARNVVGAHAAGFNTGSVGVAVIGGYGKTGLTPAARRALVKLLAWRLDLAHVDPLSTLSWLSGGNSRFPTGIPVFLRAVSGHRDTGYTDCPGDVLYDQLNSLAGEVASTGGAKIYSPFADGSLDGPVRITARLSQPRRWWVTIRNRAGATMGAGTGRGAAVDWVWDPGDAKGTYTWTITAGTDVRPASGVVGEVLSQSGPPVATTPVFEDAAVSPSVVSPNWDGYDDAAAVSYRLREPAEVAAVVTDPAGAPIMTLFSGQWQSARDHSWPWWAYPLPDGTYTLELTARTKDGRTTKERRPVIVDRTLGWVSAEPRRFSPNGDGVDDLVSFSFSLAAPALVVVEVVQYGKQVALLYADTLREGPRTIVWGGRPGGTALPDGHYDLVVKAVGRHAEVRQSARFVVRTS